LSDDGAYLDEMGSLRLNDRELDRILAGRATADNGDLNELALFVRELTHTYQVAPDAATETRHLSAIMATVRALPVANEAPAPAPTRRRGSWVPRLALVGAVAFGLFSGVAYAGALPAPVQGAVADAARHVGVSLPGAHNNKHDGQQNDVHGGGPGVVPPPKKDTNSAGETGGAEHQQHGNQNQGEQGTQNDSQGGPQQDQTNHNTQNQGNETGTSGSSGNQANNGSGQGNQGDGGAPSGQQGSSHGDSGDQPSPQSQTNQSNGDN
jgi:hypothetical protein